MGRLLHGVIKVNYADKRVSCLKTEIAVVFLNSVCLVYFHIRFLFAKIAINSCSAKQETLRYVIGVHNSVRLVHFANQRFKAYA